MTKEELRKSLDFVNEERERLQYDIDNLTYQLAKEKSKIKKALECLANEFKTENICGEQISLIKSRNKLIDILNGRSNK